MKPYYDDGTCVIYHGDCREVDAWRDADVLVTDPPYGIGWRRGTHPARRSKPHSGIENDHDTSTRDQALTLWGARPGLVFGSFHAPPPANVTQVLVWHKPDDAGVVGSTTGHRRDAEPVYLVGEWPNRSVAWSSVLRSVRRSIAAIAAETGHPHTKPVDLLRMLIERCPPGVIADPFMGSGSTLRAAKDLGRPAVGVELDERYCDIAAKRLAQEVLDFSGGAHAKERSA